MTDIELRLTADVAQATKGVGGFRKEYEQTVKAIEKPLRQIDNLQKVQESAKQASAAFFDARQKVTGLQQALEKVSPPANKLGQALGQAEKEMNRASAAVDRQKQKLDAQRGAVLATKQALDALKQSQAGVDGSPAGKGDTAAMAAAKQAVAAATAEYEKQRTTLAAHQQALNASRTSVKVLGDEYEAAAQPVRILETELSKAERNLARTTQEFDRQKTKVREQRAELKAAGVDTRNLAGEQQRLQAEMAKAQLDGRRTEAVQGIRAQSAALGQLAREQRQANLEQAKADFGITRARQYENALEQIRQQYALLRSSGKLTNRELSIAQQAYTRRIIETKTAMGQLQAEQRRLNAGGSMLPGLVSGVGAGFAAAAALRGITNQADAYNLMNARLKLATDSQQEFTTAQAELARIAQATQSPIASLVTLYGRISRPLKEAGRSQADILKVTEAVATSFRVSGATAEESQNGVIQFAQALGAGALRGEEFNSVAEQAPRLMQALAASIGVPVGALKEMASQGLLTADVVSDALVSQLDVLRKEAETLPETVGGAMTALMDQWNMAIGGTDVQPLIDQIKRLSSAISDPAFQEGLQFFTGLLVKMSALATGLASDFARLGPEFGTIAAAIAGNLTELDRLDAKIKMLRTTLSDSGPTDAVFNFFTGTTDEEIQAEIDSLSKARAALVEQQGGLNEEMQFLAEVAAAAAEAGRQKEVDANTKYIGELKKLQDEQVANAKKAGKALAAEEKKAAAELEKVRKDRLDIDKRYKEALAGLGGEGEPSYNAAQDLKIGARNALASGDVEGAQAQAQAALKMLQDLAAAGENTYGFSGFIQELQAIELAANDIEKTNAETKIAAIREQIKSLEADAAKLKDMPLSIKSDEASIEAVRSQIQQLVTDMGKQEIVLPVRVIHPDGPIVSDLPTYSGDYVLPPLPQLASGGKLRGPGTGTSDSILMWGSNGEFMQPKSTVDYYGEGFMEALRQRRIPRFAEGGSISNRALPAIPAMNPALMAGPSFPDLGRVAFDFGGGNEVSVYASPSEALNLQRLAAKFGRTRG
ncbi:tape measure protein [Pseudomonas sp. NPDC079086]|uniref:tape measure protein n=1 Tax=unclassified Pseudomonas TaxID=196821 RepID=UPI0037C7944A